MTSNKLHALSAIAAAALLFGMMGCGPTPPNPQTLPSDAQNSCTVTSTQFATWFQSGSVSLNGVVNPADSVHFSNNPNCDFYLWSKQMFLWLTSPAPATYGGGGGRILDSSAFYDVSPMDSSGNRTLLPHISGALRSFNLRAAQAGAHGLPVIFDRSGRMLEVARPLAGAIPQVRTVTGAIVAIAHVRLDQAGRPVLIDKTGKVIEALAAATTRALKPQDTQKGASPFIVQKFNIDGIQIFTDPSLSVVDVEQGQADDGVLEAQNGSLVYYATMVNDVYAYFLTGEKDHAIPSTNVFPTTQAELNNIVSFAGAHGKTFPDPNALAIEVKSSWVEAARLANLSNYITMNATIPTYDKSNPNQWVPNGQKTVQLALVGMHVVGSTAGHPEMIWATFEHVTNSPSAAYSYINTSNQTVTVAQNTAANWVFAANGSGGPFNQKHMQLSGANIVPISPFSISASDTMRMKAFGGTTDIAPNPIKPPTAASNTEIISVNNSVSGLIASGDVRNNYIFTGATWTIGGASPQPQFQNPTPGNQGNQVGTSQLSNSTMETYQQGTSTSSVGGSNCFSCHANGTLSSAATTDVSHIFSALKPLF